MSDKELEALAQELRAAYFQEINPIPEWNMLADMFKIQWLNVARFVANRDMNTEHRALYGYDLPSRVADELLNNTKWP